MRESDRIRRASGHGVEQSLITGNKKYEDFFKCFHCQYITIVQPKQDPSDLGGLCKICMKLICHQCVTESKCSPWEKKFERTEARQRFLKSAGL